MAKTRAQRKAERRRKQVRPGESQPEIERSKTAVAEPEQAISAPEPAEAPPPVEAPPAEPLAGQLPARRKPKPKAKPKAPSEERRRGAVLSFLASSWAELKRVQWPDRPTLVQASAVTLVFVAVAAAYLGALDAIFNWLVQRIL